MRINFLKIKNFRNIENAEIKPGPLLNVFVGGNAQGKTSVLESIYFSNHLKSFRTQQIKELIKFEKEKMQIFSCISNLSMEEDLLIKWEENKTSVKLNEKDVPKNSIIGKLGTVVFSPDSLSAIKQGPEKRRDLLDEAAALIFKEAQLAQKNYLRIIKQKNTALKSLKQGTIGIQQARMVVESLNEVLIPAATDLLYLRLKMSDLLNPRVEEAVSTISGKKIEIIIESYSKQKIWKEREYKEIKERISREIKDESSRVIEESLGTSLQGPHRHEIKFLFDGKDARNYCSQGQQRALILAFKIAQMVYHGEALKSFPILLLDDVLSEFDENKQKYLLDFLHKNEAQTFLTATEVRETLRDSKIFGLKSGSLEARG